MYSCFIKLLFQKCGLRTVSHWERLSEELKDSKKWGILIGVFGLRLAATFTQGFKCARRGERPDPSWDVRSQCGSSHETIRLGCGEDKERRAPGTGPGT